MVTTAPANQPNNLVGYSVKQIHSDTALLLPVHVGSRQSFLPSKSGCLFIFFCLELVINFWALAEKQEFHLAKSHIWLYVSFEDTFHFKDEEIGLEWKVTDPQVIQYYYLRLSVFIMLYYGEPCCSFKLLFTQYSYSTLSVMYCYLENYLLKHGGLKETFVISFHCFLH